MNRREAMAAAAATVVVPVNSWRVRAAPIPPLKNDEKNKDEHMIFIRPDEIKYVRPCGCEKRSGMVVLSNGDMVISSLSARKVTTAIREAEHNKQKWVELPPAECQCMTPVFHGAAPVTVSKDGGVIY